jgi:cyclophilin family peptidyl-prolyl cis-trans isomerase
MPIARSLGTLLAMNLSAVALTACGGGGSSTNASLPAGCQQAAKPKPKRVSLEPPTARVARSAQLEAVISTSCGNFTIALDAAAWPKTVSSFVHLARKGVYNGTAFQRIVPRFVIQGGDPSGTGRGGPGYTVTERPPPSTQYKHGTVAMVKTAVAPPGESASQFFVVVATDSGLPPNYAVLGRVSSGWDVVNRIASLGDPSTGDAGTPTATVAIRKVAVRPR